MVFEGENEFKRVKTGREGDRVYMLKYLSSSGQRYMYWMQDKAVEKDSDIVAKVNGYFLFVLSSFFYRMYS